MQSLRNLNFRYGTPTQDAPANWKLPSTENAPPDDRECPSQRENFRQQKMLCSTIENVPPNDDSPGNLVSISPNQRPPEREKPGSPEGIALLCRTAGQSTYNLPGPAGGA